MKYRFYLLISAIFIMNPVLSQWTDITSTFGGGISANTNMSRPIVCNINNDNYPDLLVYVLTTPTSPYSKYLRLLKNNGNNTFTDVTSLYGLPLDLTRSAGFIDFDGDSYKDLYLWDATEFQIYKNNGGTSFTNVSTQLGITTNFFAAGELTSGLNVFDYDIDGDEDILYTRAVSGVITFTAIVNNQSSFSTKTDIVTNIPGNASAGGNGASFADVDNDGDFDLIFDANLSGQFNNGVTSLFLKNSNGYTNVTATSGLPASLPATTEIFDINQDGNLDIIKGGSDCCSGPLNRVLIGAGDGTFSDQTASYNIGASWYKGYATHTDIDNDTDFDFSWSYNYGNGAGFRVLSNNNNSPTYVDITGSLGLALPNTNFEYAQFGVWLDIDNDGDMDIINNNEGWGSVTSGNVWVKLNPTQGNFLNIKLNGCGINKSGLGARIKVDIGTKTRWLYYEKSTSGTTGIFDDVFHFGLGNATTVSAITVFWPNNTTTILNNIPGNQNLVITSGTAGTATITPAGSTTICQGSSVALNANSGAGLTYQWYNNAVAISGAANSTYSANASGSYTVVVTNASTCSATSTATVVTVNALPTATITPTTTTTFCQGGSVVLNANTGAGLTYQWKLNGTNITGATSSSYTANASGSYTVVVTNTSTCSSTSTATPVTVNALPTATITPATTTTFCQGGSVVLNANTGTGLTYQWRLNGNPISGATSSSYTANASGSYTVVVTNTSVCSATSTATVVTVNALPTATITPATATTFCQGGSVVLNANTGAGLSYQWRLNGNPISGATSSSYTANASGSYTVVVTNSSTCSSTSTATVVTVNALPSATITPASATTFCQGGSVVLNANTGTGLTYQWRLNGNPISGATSSSYTANASGSYTVVVTNASTCSSTSTATVVTVNAIPTATITPATATTFCQGGSIVLSANTGTGLTYQWFNNASAISGATNASYSATVSGSYTVVISSGASCSSTSSAIVVTVSALPTATNTPATTTTFCQGGSVALNANTGTGLTYQWRLNGNPISGGTSSSYTANASGSYTVVVTNASTCSSTSTGTVVTVNALPTATLTPATATTFCQGGSVVLNANTGTGLTYQWFNNASVINGAAGVSYTATASGSYTVVVTNSNGCNATSSATSVLVNANSTYFADTDNDGFGNLLNSTSTCIQPAGYVLNNLDCNDSNGQINPSANEVCNSIDDNCNSQTDEGLTFTTYYSDLDNDGFGSGAGTSLCSNPGAGYSTNALDCNNANSAINPSATEICNSADDNCNLQIDEGLLFQNYYQDFDGDGFGFGAPTSLCTSQTGYVNNVFDCNDFQAQVNPIAQEICNGVDDNCNTLIDDGLQFTNYFLDGDQDGFGAGSPQSLCSNPGNGYSTLNTDCNDAIEAINPSSTEICNNLDDNCNLQIDEGLVFTNYFADNDSDGFGNPAQATSSCSPINGMVTNNGDCNDANANINPLAVEIGGNGIDENCDGQIDNSIFELNASINLYPNPTRSELNIQITNALVGNEMYIFDALGKLVYKQQLLSTQTTLSMHEYADGNYIFRVGELVKRIVVQH
jgi:hypothetical protein